MNEKKLVYCGLAGALALGLGALGPVCTALAVVAESDGQTAESGWYEVRDTRPETRSHYYRWDLKADVTVTDGVVSGLTLNPRTSYGDEVAAKNRKYFEPVKLVYEADVPDLGIRARDYAAAVDGLDAVSGATSTSHWARVAIADALAKWNEEHPAATSFEVNAKNVTAGALRSAAEKADATEDSATSITVGAKARKISKGAFSAYANVRTLVVKSTKLTKRGVKGSLRGSAVKTVKVPKAKRAAYKKAFAKSNSGKKVTVR